MGVLAVRDGAAVDFPEADEGLWVKSATHNGEPNREAESTGPPLAGVGGAALGSGDDRLRLALISRIFLRNFGPFSRKKFFAKFSEI